MLVNSRQSKWPQTDTSGQALGETSKSLSNLALYASKSKSTNKKKKINEHVKPGSFPTEKTPFKTVHVDLAGPLPEAEGFKYIQMAIDILIAVPLKSTEATEVWRQFEENWIATFGVPTLLLSDRGS